VSELGGAAAVFENNSRPISSLKAS